MKPREGLGAGGRPEKPKNRAGYWATGIAAAAAATYIAVDVMDYWSDVWQNGPINRGGSHGDQSDTSERTRRAPVPAEDSADSAAADAEAPAEDPAEASLARPEHSPELVLQTIQMTGLQDGERMVGILAIDRDLLPQGLHAPEPRSPQEADLLDRVREVIEGHEPDVSARLVLLVVDQAPPAVDGVTQVQFPRILHIDGQDINLEQLHQGLRFAAVPEHHEAYIDVGGHGNDHLRITGHALSDGEHGRRDRRDEGEHHGRRGHHRPRGG